MITRPASGYRPVPTRGTFIDSAQVLLHRQIHQWLLGVLRPSLPVQAR